MSTGYLAYMVVVGAIFVFILGGGVGSCGERSIIRREAIEAGVARYHPQTGSFEFIPAKTPDPEQ